MSTSSSRYAQITDDDLKDLREQRIPQSTKDKVKWSINLFRNWHENWKVRMDDILKVYKSIDEMDSNDLNYCLQYFIPEIRKVNGEKYPPRTLKEIVAGIQHFYCYEINKQMSIFLDKEFKETREILDAAMKQSAMEGNRKPVKRAAPVTIETEESLWTNGVFGRGDGKQILNTLIYYFGLMFSLRARQEQRNLIFGEKSQITLEKDDDGLERLCYVERCSKNLSFGLHQSRKEPKNTYLYENPDKSRCIVSLYKFYIEHRPESHGLPGNDAFYLTPIPNPKSNVWFKPIPMGINTLAQTTSRIMSSFGDGKFYTNTSLRRTAKTRLVEAGIPPELARKKTGHMSSADAIYLHQGTAERQMCEAITKTTKTSLKEIVAVESHCATSTSIDRQPTIEVEKEGSTTKVKIFL